MSPMSETEHRPSNGSENVFARVVSEHGRPIRRALVAAYGPVAAEDIFADVLAWAWENRERLASLRNPAGYLYRVGQSASRKYLDRPTPAWPGEAPRPPGVDLDLLSALETLTPNQRAAVVLVLGYGWTLKEAATQLGCSVSTLRNHVRRGTRTLERRLGDGSA